MGNKNQRRALWAVFVLALLGVGLGWLWMIQGLVESENENSRNEIRKKEERLLTRIVDQRGRISPGLFPGYQRRNYDDQIIYNLPKTTIIDRAEPDMDSFLSGEKPHGSQALRLARNSKRENTWKESEMRKFAWENLGYSGVWAGVRHSDGNTDESLFDWPEDVDSSIDSIQSLPWGNVIEGRDQLGVLILRFLREGGDIEAIRSTLEEGVWDYSHRPMNPGFRLLLIKALEAVAPSEKLSRLKLAETIRSVEGDISQLPLKLHKAESDGVAYFYNKKELERNLDRGVMLSSDRPPGRASVKMEEFRHWPFLSFEPGHGVTGEAIGESSKAVLQVGILTGVAALLLIIFGMLIGKRELQRAKARTDLAASVAHELRTPLAGQRVILESLQKNKEYDDEYLSMALRENERLGDLAEEFLTFSRLERGVLEVQLKSLRLSEVIRPVIAGLQEQWDEEIHCELGDTPVMADEAAVATIARNLLENSWKYSDVPREISISSVSNEIEVGFSVTDNGIGLSKADQKRIFRQFYRVDQQLSRSREGLGIGLSIVRRLVDAMEGRLEVESELGKGSTFTVYLKKGGVA